MPSPSLSNDDAETCVVMSAANRLALLASATGVLDLRDVVEGDRYLAGGSTHVDLHLAELLRSRLGLLHQRRFTLPSGIGSTKTSTTRTIFPQAGGGGSAPSGLVHRDSTRSAGPVPPVDASGSYISSRSSCRAAAKSNPLHIEPGQTRRYPQCSGTLSRESTCWVLRLNFCAVLRVFAIPHWPSPSRANT